MNVDEPELSHQVIADAVIAPLTAVMFAVVSSVATLPVVRRKLAPLVKDPSFWDRVKIIPERQFFEVFGFSRTQVDDIVAEMELPCSAP
jgi:inactivated superfamily I helicase